MVLRQCRFESPPHLPPLSAAPILENYDLDQRRLRTEHLLPAPVDDRGVVDVFKTVELALSLVDDEYVWPRHEPKPDVHHFVWERDWYHPRHYNGSAVPRDYRDKIAFHKGYLPRQLHEFMHAVIAPPLVPDFDTMLSRTRDYDIAVSLFESARSAVTVRKRPHRISGVPVCPDTGEVLLDDEIMMRIVNNFDGYFQNSRMLYEDGNVFIPDAIIMEKSPDLVARELGKVAACGALNLMPFIYGNKKKAA